MLNRTMKKITGTFIQPLLGDTGIENRGLKEWEQDFQMLKAMGMDTLVIIRCECEQNGVRVSGLDPRSTTWKEDDNLLDMFFRLGDKYGFDLYLGGVQNITNLHLGDWKKEIDDNKRFYDRMIPRYQNHKCLKGIYITLEALPWHFNFLDINLEVLKYAKQNFPQYKTMMSPGFSALHGDLSSYYNLDEWRDIFGRYFFEPAAGLLDACALQDSFAAPACYYGEIQSNGLDEWSAGVKELMHKCNIEFWTNIESFQRPFPGHGEARGVFRQGDYRTLYTKLDAASRHAEKIITFEYFSCMSPNTEWGSARRLLSRYLEMTGQDPVIISEIFDK